MKEGNATVLALALLLLVSVFTPPVPFSARGLIHLHAFSSELTMPEPRSDDVCLISGNRFGVCHASPNTSSSLTDDATGAPVSDAVKEEAVIPGPEWKKHEGNERLRKEHLTFDEARQQFSPPLEANTKKDDVIDSTNRLSALSFSEVTPATRRVLLAVAAGAGASLLLTMMVVGTFMCSALGVIGLVLTMLACGLVMCVFTCAFFSFCCGLGISILVSLSIAAAVVSIQLCMHSLGAVQSMTGYASGG